MFDVSNIGASRLTDGGRSAGATDGQPLTWGQAARLGFVGALLGTSGFLKKAVRPSLCASVISPMARWAVGMYVVPTSWAAGLDDYLTPGDVIQVSSDVVTLPPYSAAEVVASEDQLCIAWQDAIGSRVWSRLYSIDGRPIAPNPQSVFGGASTAPRVWNPDHSHLRPGIAVLSSGYALAWQNFQSVHEEVRFTLWAPATGVGEGTIVSPPPPPSSAVNHQRPQVVNVGDGFGVVWWTNGYENVNDSGVGKGLSVQLYNASASKVEDPRRIDYYYNSYSGLGVNDGGSFLALAAIPDGFLAAHFSVHGTPLVSAGQTGGAIVVRRFDRNARHIADLVDAFHSGFPYRRPAIASDGNRTILVWQRGRIGSGSDIVDYDLLSKAIPPDGFSRVSFDESAPDQRLSPNEVATGIGLAPDEPDVALVRDGHLVVWSAPVNDGKTRSVFLKYYHSLIGEIGPYLVSEGTGNETDPRVVGFPKGAAVVWRSQQSNATDAHVMLRILSYPVPPTPVPTWSPTRSPVRALTPQPPTQAEQQPVMSDSDLDEANTIIAMIASLCGIVGGTWGCLVCVYHNRPDKRPKCIPAWLFCSKGNVQKGTPVERGKGGARERRRDRIGDRRAE